MDVAPLLARACAAMQPGELVQHESFSLFESVSAVEIGEFIGTLLCGCSCAYGCCE